MKKRDYFSEEIFPKPRIVVAKNYPNVEDGGHSDWHHICYIFGYLILIVYPISLTEISSRILSRIFRK